VKGCLTKLILFTLLFQSCQNDESGSDANIRDLIKMEEQIQAINRVQLYRGDEYLSDIKWEIAASKGIDHKYKKTILESLFGNMEHIDQLSHEMLLDLQKLKIQLIKKANEDVTNSGILQNGKIDKNEILSSFNLYAIKHPENTSSAEELFLIHNDAPSVIGNELFDRIKTFRRELVNAVGTYNWRNDVSFNVSTVDFNSFKDKDELIARTTAMIDKQQANLKEDRRVLIDLYVMLSKPAMIQDSKGNELPWVVDQFQSASLVGAIGTLSVLEQEVLKARVLALSLYASKVNICGYGFDKIMPIASGPNVVHVGEVVELEVGMVAFDSYNEPKVMTDLNNAEIVYSNNGKGLVRFVPAIRGEQTIRGTVAIKNRSGVVKEEAWEWKIYVLPQKKLNE